MRRFLVLAALLVAVVPASDAAAQELTIYSSLPFQGPARPSSEAVVRGMRLALQDAGGQAGGRPIRYLSFDDGIRQARGWAPEAVAENARRAAEDQSTIAYLGEFNSGASAISIPMLNEAGILQISPSNTAVGLTRGGAGADPGEPDKYYPTGDRTFGRVVPNDAVQGRAAAVAMKEAGVTRLLVVHDGDIYGRGLATIAARAARAQGIRVVRTRRLGHRGRNARSIARSARRTRANGVFYGGITANGAPRLWRALYRSKRSLNLFAGDGVAESNFVEHIGGAARRTRVMVSTLSPEAYPPAGQAVLQRLGPNTDPYAIYGYEAMAVALDAINRGGPTREGTVKAFFATQNRDSVLGRYSIDLNGDTTLTQYGVYRIANRELRFERAVSAG